MSPGTVRFYAGVCALKYKGVRDVSDVTTVVIKRKQFGIGTDKNTGELIITVPRETPLAMPGLYASNLRLYAHGNNYLGVDVLASFTQIWTYLPTEGPFW